MTLATDSYSDRLEQLYRLEFFGMKLGLENIHALLQILGDPQEQYPTIHIAGTNGKGSVASTFAAIYQCAGKRTGLYTSPHLVDFRERIRVDGQMIDREFVMEFIERVWPIVEERKMTFFEVTTAMAFRYFADRGVDVAVIETGLGGRLDATNVLRHPEATVITSIGMDHMAQLGDSIESIASEKAGIFKAGVPAIVNCADEVRHVFEEKGADVGAPLVFVRDVELRPEFTLLSPSLPGGHQEDNLRTVLTTLQTIDANIPVEVIEQGIMRSVEIVGLRARLEHFHSEDLDDRGVTLLLDVAHNPAAFARLAEHFRSRGVRPTVVLGFMKDKDVEAALGEVRTFAARLIAVAAKTERALVAGELALQANSIGITTEIAKSVTDGVSFAASTARPGDVVLLTGSHYIIGEFLQNFQKTHRVIL